MAKEPLEHSFKTNVLLKNILGKDLINDDNIAIQELVKNSYDAGAKKIAVVLENLKANNDAQASSYGKKSSKTSRITIRDDGKGMDTTDIDSKWLNIAFSEKKEIKEELGRPLAGNKGVGRFSCDRLGEYLDIYSRKEGKVYVHLYLDWKDFEIENEGDLQIQAIKVAVEPIEPRDFESKTGLKAFSSGTTLVISKLRRQWSFPSTKKKDKDRDIWDTRKLLELKKSLEKLINPNIAFKKSGLDMELVASEFTAEDEEATQHEKINGRIRNQIFEKLDFKTTSIEAEIDAAGKTVHTVLKNKGEEVFRLTETNSQFQLLKGIKITIYYLNTYTKVYFHRQTGLRSFNFGSMHLFINGFRVPPYGDLGNDWLRIERMKQQGLGDHLGTREIVGRIEIRDLDGSFKIVSSREGLVDDQRFRQLVGEPGTNGLFDEVFKKLSRFVIDGLNWDKSFENDKDIEKRVFVPGRKINQAEEVYVEDQDKKDMRAMGAILSILSLKHEQVEKLWINPDLIEKLEGEEKERVSRLLGEIESIEPGLVDKGTSKAFKSLRVLFNKQEKRIKEAEQVTVVLKKKIREQEVKVRNLFVETKRKEREIFFHKRLLSQDLKSVLSLQHDIGLAADVIRRNLANLKNAVHSGKKLTNEQLLDFVEAISFQNNTIVSISNFITKANFKTESSEVEGDLIEFLKQHVENVCKGMVTTHDGQKMGIHFAQVKNSDIFSRNFRPIEVAIIVDNLLSNASKAKARNVYISVSKTAEDEMEIRVKDDGRGVPKAIRNEIFDFGVTSTSGSGMGLYHIRDILKKINGSISLNEELPKGTEFILRIRK